MRGTKSLARRRRVPLDRRTSKTHALEEDIVAVIRLPEIEEIFTVLDRRGISREAVVIPLTKRDPGTVRVLPNEKLEIVVPESQTVGAWLPALERLIDDVRGSPSA